MSLSYILNNDYSKDCPLECYYVKTLLLRATILFRYCSEHSPFELLEAAENVDTAMSLPLRLS